MALEMHLWKYNIQKFINDSYKCNLNTVAASLQKSDTDGMFVFSNSNMNDSLIIIWS